MEARQVTCGVAVRRRLPSYPASVVTYVVIRHGVEPPIGVTGRLIQYSSDTYLYTEDDVVAAAIQLASKKNARIVVYVDRESDAKRMKRIPKHTLAAINTDILAIYRVLTPKSIQPGIAPPVQVDQTVDRLMEMFYQNMTVANGIICTTSSSDSGYVGYRFLPNKYDIPVGATIAEFDTIPCLRGFILDRMLEINDRHSRDLLVTEAHFDSIRRIPGYENVVSLYEKSYNTMDKWGILYGLMFEKRAKKKSKTIGRVKKSDIKPVIAPPLLLSATPIDTCPKKTSIQPGIPAMPEVVPFNPIPPPEPTMMIEQPREIIPEPTLNMGKGVILPSATTDTVVITPIPEPTFDDVLKSGGDVWPLIYAEWKSIGEAVPFHDFIAVYLEKMAGYKVSLDGLPAVLKICGGYDRHIPCDK